MTTTPKTELFIRHATFARALSGAVALSAKYGCRFAVGRSALVSGYQWTIVKVGS